MMRSNVMIFVMASWALTVSAGDPGQAPLPESKQSTIGYSTVAEALADLRSKPGVEVRVESGWTIVNDASEDKRDLWSFTPDGHPAHPSAVKRSIIMKDGVVWIDMNVLCQAQKAPCDDLVREFNALNDRIRESIQRKSETQESHPRSKEAEGFAVHWLELLEAGDADGTFELLTDSFRANLTRTEWKESVDNSIKSLGPLQERKLRRIVWYLDPPDAPSPGTYAAVEFDSVYKNSQSHFRYVMLHSLNGEPFRVMRDESTFVLKGEPKVSDP